MGLSFWHIIIVLLVVLVIFGAGKLPSVMGDLGKGIKNFKAGMDDSKKTVEQPPPPQLPLPPADKDNTHA